MSDQPHRLGGPSNYWLYHPSTGYDLTRSLTPRLTIPTTTTQPITICPSTTVLIIVDMQNFFLDPAAGRPRNPLAVEAERKLIEVGIPACNEAGVQVVHLTWGLEEGQDMSPTVIRGFGAVLDGNLEDVDVYKVAESFGERPTVGKEIGDVKLEDGSVVPGGKLLVRDQWNTALHQPFEDIFSGSRALPLPQVRFHKSGISGFGSPSSPIVTFLKDQGIKTLLFTGVNTDQCVMGSLQDAVGMGFDAVLMKDGCATASPDYARKMAEFNCRKNWGFVASLDDLADGVRSMSKGR